MKRIKLEKQHYQWGLTAFLVIVCCVLAFFAIYRFDVIQRFFTFALNVLAPFIYGLVMAYLICPIYNATVRGTYSLLNRGEMKLKHDMGISKGVGTVLSVALILVVLAGVFWMIIPGLVNSIINVVEILPSGVHKLNLWVDAKMTNLPIAQETIDKWMDSLTDKAIEFATNTILPHSQSLAAGVSQGVIGAVGFMMDFVIGIIISVYFLNSKDTFLAQIKKFIVANFKERTVEEIFSGASYTNKTFGGFISGKIIDSVIIGIICFLVMSVFGWEYSLLISCIVGITNIIPFFGPFIGAIPSTLLLILVNPMHALYFVIFVLILQQFDGNILGPKILGDSTGLESFWVLFAVLVGGGLFGFIGMVIGIPVFAVIYYYAGRSLNRKLERKGFSTDLKDYRIDPYRTKPAKTKKRRRFSLKKKEGTDSDDN
ncbi:MAG: AI-2E family transporter [Firmicutes bacterium]|nr:AI-2E family transporter [Bacillota bacterium]